MFLTSNLSQYQQLEELPTIFFSKIWRCFSNPKPKQNYLQFRGRMHATYVEYCYAAPPRKLLPRACCSSWAYCFFSACCPGHAAPPAHDSVSPGLLIPLRMMLPSSRGHAAPPAHDATSPQGMLLLLRMMLPPPGHAAPPAHNATSPRVCCSPCA